MFAENTCVLGEQMHNFGAKNVGNNIGKLCQLPVDSRKKENKTKLIF